MREPAFSPWYRWRCNCCHAPITRVAPEPPTGFCPGCDTEGDFRLIDGPPQADTQE